MAAANRSWSEDDEVSGKSTSSSRKTEGKGSKGNTSKVTRGTGSATSKNAAGTKRSTAKNTVGTKGGTARNTAETEEKPQDNSSLKMEIVLMAVIVVSVLMILGFFGIGGAVGDFFGRISGVFGIPGYLFPFVLFTGVAFGTVNHGNKVAGRKLYGGIGLYVALCCMVQLITYGGGANKKLLVYLEQPWKNKNGGGVIGGIIVRGLYSILGTAGTYVVLIAIILALLMLITEKFLFAFLGRKGKEGYEVFVEKQEERKQERLKKKAVTFNMVDPSSKGSGAKPDGKRRNTAIGEGTAAEKENTAKIDEKDRKTEREGVAKAGKNELEYFPINRGRVEEKPADNKDTEKEPPVYQQELDKKFKGMTDRGEEREGEENGREGNLPSSLDLDFGVLDELMNQNEGESFVEGIPEGFQFMPQSRQAASTVPSRSVAAGGQKESGDYKESAMEEAGEDTVESVDYIEGEEEESSKTVISEQGGTSTQTSQSTQNTQSGQNAQMSQSTQNTQSGQNAQTSQSVQNTQSGQNAQTSQSAQNTQSVQNAQTSQSAQNTQSEQNAQTSQSTQNTQSGQNAQTSQSTQSTQSKPNIQKPQKTEKPYVFPPVDLLEKSKVSEGSSDEALRETALKLKNTLESFGVRATITNVSCGPTVTRYEIQPEQGVKVSRITGLTDDIKLNLAASEIRIEAPIPGKAAVGIEIPNKEVEPVSLRDLIESHEFKKSKSKVTFAVGKDIGNQTIVTDIAKMPHVLIAGATGAGKSVCINTLIMSIIYKADPKDVKLILIDPKVVELSIYNGIPHLLVPVVTDCKKALGALNWAVAEMTERYRKFSELTVRDLEGYNKKIANAEYEDKGYEKMPQIVLIVDEMADLMMVAQGDVEGAIVRLTQLARAAGIHLVIATQRPSVNVITGLIKANIPSRIAFSVSSQVDSRTILDGSGAEHLLGKGDMLFAPRDLPKPIRVQGAFVSDDEVNKVVEFLKKQNEDITYDTAVSEKIEAAVLEEKEDKQQESEDTDGRDSYFEEAGRLIIKKNKASIGLLQRALKIGFNRAARIMDQLCEYGVVGEEQGTKPREILMSMETFEELLN